MTHKMETHPFTALLRIGAHGADAHEVPRCVEHALAYGHDRAVRRCLDTMVAPPWTSSGTVHIQTNAQAEEEEEEDSGDGGGGTRTEGDALEGFSATLTLVWGPEFPLGLPGPVRATLDQYVSRCLLPMREIPYRADAGCIVNVTQIVAHMLDDGDSDVLE